MTLSSLSLIHKMYTSHIPLNRIVFQALFPVNSRLQALSRERKREQKQKQLYTYTYHSTVACNIPSVIKRAPKSKGPKPILD